MGDREEMKRGPQKDPLSIKGVIRSILKKHGNLPNKKIKEMLLEIFGPGCRVIDNNSSSYIRKVKLEFGFSSKRLEKAKNVARKKRKEQSKRAKKNKAYRKKLINKVLNRI